MEEGRAAQGDLLMSRGNRASQTCHNGPKSTSRLAATAAISLSLAAVKLFPLPCCSSRRRARWPRRRRASSPRRGGGRRWRGRGSATPPACRNFPRRRPGSRAAPAWLRRARAARAIRRGAVEARRAGRERDADDRRRTLPARRARARRVEPRAAPGGGDRRRDAHARRGCGSRGDRSAGCASSTATTSTGAPTAIDAAAACAATL